MQLNQAQQSDATIKNISPYMCLSLSLSQIKKIHALC